MHKKDRQPLVLELCVRLEGAYVYECEKREKEEKYALFYLFGIDDLICN